MLDIGECHIFSCAPFLSALDWLLGWAGWCGTLHTFHVWWVHTFVVVVVVVVVVFCHSGVVLHVVASSVADHLVFTEQ